MQTVYMASIDGGDGSGYPNWFKSKEVLESASDAFPEELWRGYNSYNFPDDFDFDACGIHFSDNEWLGRIEDGE